MDIERAKHDLLGGFSSILMAMKLLKPGLSDPELISLLELSEDKVRQLKSISEELLDNIKINNKTKG